RGGRAATWLKAAVSAALLLFLLRRIDAKELGGMLRQTDPLWVLVSVLVGILPMAISSWKWRILLRARGNPLPYGRLFNLYFAGLFLNNFFPSTIGGDLFRSHAVGKEVGDRAHALASVFMERFTGLTALAAIALVAFAGNLSSFRDPRFAVALGAGLTAYFALALAVALPGPLAWGLRRFPSGLPGRLIGKLVRVQSAIHAYSGQARAVAAALALSLLFYLVAMANIYVCSRAFGIALPPRTLVVIVPVIMFITSLPITVGGLGLAEWAYFFTFGASGAGASPGLLVGLLLRANSLLYSLWGGAVYAGRSARGTGGDAPRSWLL
ncbi:MAG TPA: lysylphosphatidylglycerol synthase transmembrane domain-containing protein, partial [Candidatus Methanoperedens sp.]|nr:lysylphosphatidylglycerol synthase transmembrane domain-containing protein [Candidatus Methanoperedens sp.]